MRLFETYPPSSFVVALVAAPAIIALPWQCLLAFAAGVAVAMVGRALDRYGVQ